MRTPAEVRAGLEPLTARIERAQRDDVWAALNRLTIPREAYIAYLAYRRADLPAGTHLTVTAEVVNAAELWWRTKGKP